MPEIIEEGAGLGIRKSEAVPLESIPEPEKEKTRRHLEKMMSGTEGIRKGGPEVVPGMVGYIGSIRWERVPVPGATFCHKCGDLLGSQYGVVEYGNTDGPYFCIPEHLQEAKGNGV